MVELTRQDVWDLCSGMSLGEAQQTLPASLRSLGLPEGDIDRVVDDLPSYYSAPHTPNHDPETDG